MLQQKGELRLVQCGHCSMIYLNPVPGELVSGDYYGRIAEDYYLSPAKLKSDYAPVRFERELRLFHRYCLSGAVLDVGCSTGGFLFQLNRRFPGCYQILGIDVSGPALDYAESRGLSVTRGNFPEAIAPEKPFDAITFWAVLEHLAEPKRFLEASARLLKPNGICFILVPNMKSLAVRLLGSKYRYIYPQHLNYFTAGTVTKLVEPFFSIVELCSMHFNPIVIWQDWRGGGRDVPNVQRGQLLKKTTAYKQNPALRPLRVIYKLAETALGRFQLADNLAVVLRKK